VERRSNGGGHKEGQTKRNVPPGSEHLLSGVSVRKM